MELTPFQRYMVLVARPMLRVRHLALIMDGNRRFAQSSNLEHSQGHLRGFHKLLEVIEYCTLLGIRTVTIYGFSLLNFSRTRREISDLLNLFVDIAGSGGQLEEFTRRVRCRVRFCGDLSFLGSGLRSLLADIEARTAQFDAVTLNICASYGARNEIARALGGSRSPPEFYRSLHTGEFPPPDVLIRTSGESRLSDFLIYQCSEFTCFYFVRDLWPELSFNRLVYILMHHSVFEPVRSFVGSFTRFKRDSKLA